MSSPVANGQEHGSRRRLSEEEVAQWPTVDEGLISNAKHRAVYKRRVAAIALLVGNASALTAAAAAKISDRELRRLVSRCRAISPDGRVWGYRALVSNFRTKAYCRTKELGSDPEGAVDPESLNVYREPASSGMAGAFGRLLRDRSDIREGLIDALGRAGPEAYKRLSMKGRKLHLRFLSLCKDAGLTENDYPLNTLEKGRRSLFEWVHRVYLPRYASAYVKAEHGADAAVTFDHEKDGPFRQPPAKDWDEFQLDEITLDVAARYELLDPSLLPISLELQRCKIIICLDVGSKSVAAWRLVLAREPNVCDLLEVFWDAIAGPPKRAESIPNLDYNDGAGYPCSVLPQLRYRVPRRILLDNSLAHLANAFRSALLNVCASEVHLGKPKDPKARAEIESENSSLVRKHVHELPGTTGSQPKDPLRKRAKQPLNKLVRVCDVEHDLDVYFANRNGEARESSNFISPIERLRYSLKHSLIDPISLTHDKRHQHFFGLVEKVKVKGDLKNGRRPFVNFCGKRYRGKALNNFVGLLGKMLIARATPRDLRTLTLFDEKGAELGTLRAEGKWGAIPHDLRLRRLFSKLKRQGSLGTQAEDHPLHALYVYLNEGAPRNKTMALQLAYLLEYLRGKLPEIDKQLVRDLTDSADLDAAIEEISTVPLNDTCDPQSSAEASRSPVSEESQSATTDGLSPGVTSHPPTSADAELPSSPVLVTSNEASYPEKQGVNAAEASIFILPRRVIRR